MKNRINVFQFAALMALAVAVISVSGCKKDKDEDDQPAKKSYRITSVSFEEDGTNYTTSISYNAANQITMFSQKMDGQEYYKNMWEWNGNKVTVTEAIYIGSGWVDQDNRFVMTYQNGKVVASETYLDNALQMSSEYTWNGDKLTKEEVEMFIADTSIIYQIQYSYDGNLLTRADWYIASIPWMNQIIEYADGKPVTLKSYNTITGNILQESSKFTYTGNNMTKIENFNIVEGAEGDVMCVENRIYDANNCVSSRSMSCTGEDIITQLAIYEEGTSNFNDYLLTQVSWVSAYLFPNTFPSELAYKKK